MDIDLRKTAADAAYIAVGVLPPAVLFSDGIRPTGDDWDRIAGELGRMLEAADGNRATRRSRHRQ